MDKQWFIAEYLGTIFAYKERKTQLGKKKRERKKKKWKARRNDVYTFLELFLQVKKIARKILWKKERKTERK